MSCLVKGLLKTSLRRCSGFATCDPRKAVGARGHGPFCHGSTKSDRACQLLCYISRDGAYRSRRRRTLKRVERCQPLLLRFIPINSLRRSLKLKGHLAGLFPMFRAVPHTFRCFGVNAWEGAGELPAFSCGRECRNSAYWCSFFLSEYYCALN